MPPRGFDQGDLVMATLRYFRPRIVPEEGSSCGTVVVVVVVVVADVQVHVGGVLPGSLVGRARGFLLSPRGSVSALVLPSQALGLLGLPSQALGLLGLPALPRGLLLGHAGSSSSW